MNPNRIFNSGLVRQALDAGKKRYFTGKPCKYGHIAERMVSSGQCVTCLNLRRPRYSRGQNPITTALYNATSHKRTWAYRGKKREEKLKIIAGRPRPDICEVCGKNAPGQIVFDHNHASGAFRGWICSSCNIILGMVGDSVEILRKLADYVGRF